MITSTSNTTIKNLINLIKKKKYRDEKGVFVVEGTRISVEVPEELIKEIFVSETFYNSEKNYLDKIHEKHNVIILSDKVFEHVSDTKSPQGILLVVKQLSYNIKDILEKKKTPLLVILDAIRDPGNLGTIMRTSEAAGADLVIMSEDTVDIYNPKVVRSTMGSIFRVPFVKTEDLVSCILKLRELGIDVFASDLSATGTYLDFDYKNPTGFVVGNEANGINEKVKEVSNKKIIIPMEGKIESLNAAISTSILLFEASRQRMRKK
ncbi:MAG: RNA methyltransferase [Lachnospiraceae bacterium]|jgi:TrmH family RNA methyltransferase|nr:RNA methyltransferase [Lachnospiraceae bacterium]